MAEQPLDYQSPNSDTLRTSRVRTATIIAASIVLLVNAALLAAAAADRSWNALAIAVLVGPITNGILLVVALFCIPVVKSGLVRPSIGGYLAAGIGLPVLAGPLDFFIIGSMGLHGC